MSRPQRRRRICVEPEYARFSPDGIPSSNLTPIVLFVDEFEVIRLVDLEQLTHEQCAAQMGVSRTTVTEIYQRARFKLADSLVNGRPLEISGGNYHLCDGTSPWCSKRACCRTRQIATTLQEKKGDFIMRIAVTYENGMIFQHFGHTEQFKIYDIKDGKVVSSQIVNTMGSGHGALAGFLLNGNVDVLICGGIGGGAQTALAQAGIKLYGGASGEADAAVNALLAGNLGYDPDVHCDHHDHESEHSCGTHGCGSHSCH